MVNYHVGIYLHRKEIRHALIRGLLLAGDMIAIITAYAAGFLARFYHQPFLEAFPATKGIPEIDGYLRAAPVIVFMWALAIHLQGGYRRIKMAAIDEAIRLFRAAIMGTVLAMSAMFLYRESEYSRLVFILGGSVGYVFLFAFRELVKIGYVLWVTRNRRPQRVLILGNGYMSLALEKILERQGDRAILKKPQASLEDVYRTIARSRIGEVLVAKTNFDHKDAVKLAAFCEERSITFRLLPDILEIRMGEVIIDESLGIPTFQLKPVSLHGSSFITKRVMDVLLASVIVGVLFMPLMIISLLIKLTSPGPVLYKHERMGYRGRPFQFMKFRTMVQDADARLEALKAKSDRGGPVFKMKNDPRITWIGKFLRRYSIDELPQVLNVLRGEMSLVGPRPQVLWEARVYDEWAKKRLNVLPGITGLWQVSGRAELTYEEMIDLDIYYIEHWSPGLDIKILLKTFPVVFLGKGAY